LRRPGRRLHGVRYGQYGGGFRFGGPRPAFSGDAERPVRRGFNFVRITYESAPGGYVVSRAAGVGARLPIAEQNLMRI